MQRSVLILILALISSQILANDQLKAMSRFDKEMLDFKSTESCLVSNFLRAASGQKSSDDIFEKCDECNSNDAFNYYCHHVNFLTSLNSRDYASASNHMERLAQSFEKNNSDYSRKISISYRSLAKKYANVTGQNEGEEAVNLYYRDGFWKIKLKEEFWIFDSGATFGAGDVKECIENNYALDNALDSFANLEQHEFCTFELIEGVHLPLIINPNYNIIGLVFFRMFDEVKTSIELKELQELNIYFNGKFLIIPSSLHIGKREIEHVNMCLDTGAEKSVLLPKIYPLIRQDFIESETIQLTSRTVNGTSKKLGKIIGPVKLNIGRKTLSFVTLPQIFRQPGFAECDILVGMDVLKYVYSINFNSMKIVFSL